MCLHFVPLHMSTYNKDIIIIIRDKPMTSIIFKPFYILLIFISILNFVDNYERMIDCPLFIFPK